MDIKQVLTTDTTDPRSSKAKEPEELGICTDCGEWTSLSDPCCGAAYSPEDGGDDESKGES